MISYTKYTKKERSAPYCLCRWHLLVLHILSSYLQLQYCPPSECFSTDILRDVRTSFYSELFLDCISHYWTPQKQLSKIWNSSAPFTLHATDFYFWSSSYLHWSDLIACKVLIFWYSFPIWPILCWRGRKTLLNLNLSYSWTYCICSYVCSKITSTIAACIVHSKLIDCCNFMFSSEHLTWMALYSLIVLLCHYETTHSFTHCCNSINYNF